jgi:hypothetical protein
MVEVVLTLGVIVFALVTIVALVPVGIRSSTDSLQESQAIDILSAVVADRRATPLSTASSNFALPPLTNATSATVTTNNFFGMTDADQSTGTTLSQAHYRIDYSFTLPASGTLTPAFGYFRASWPAASAKPASFVEIVVTFPQP